MLTINKFKDLAYRDILRLNEMDGLTWDLANASSKICGAIRTRETLISSGSYSRAPQYLDALREYIATMTSMTDKMRALLAEVDPDRYTDEEGKIEIEVEELDYNANLYYV